MKISKAKAEQIKKLEKAAKAKSRRIMNQYNYSLPVPDKANFTTKNEINAYVKSLKEFTNSNYMRFKNIGQIYAPEKDIKELFKANAEYIKRREQFYSQIKDKPFVTASGATDTTTDQYAKTIALSTKNKYFQFLNPQDINLDTYTRIEQITAKLDRLRKQGTDEYWDEKTERFKDNFIKSLEIIHDYSDLEVSDIVSSIKDMNAEEFLNMYYRTDELSGVFVWTNADAMMIEAQPKLDRIRTLINYFTSDGK